jgi:hypothetical protein
MGDDAKKNILMVEAPMINQLFRSFLDGCFIPPFWRLSKLHIDIMYSKVGEGETSVVKHGNRQSPICKSLSH